MKKIIRLLAAALVFQACADPLRALTIVRIFDGGIPPTNNTGTGNLTNIFNAACDVWQSIILDDFTLTLHCVYTNDGGGEHILLAQGGTPNRETEGVIEVNDNNQPGNYSWFMDPTPLQCPQATNYFVYATNLGGGTINAIRYFSWQTNGPQMDLFTAILHEIGHSLGMSTVNYSFIAQSASGSITLTNGPYAGTVVSLQTNNAGIVAHIGYIIPTGGTLMSGSYSPGQRMLPSVLDLAVIAQLSGFTNINWNLVSPVPSPSIAKNTTLTVSWAQSLPTPPAKEYSVQECADLRSAQWSTATNVMFATNGIYSIQVAPTNHAFFRLTAQ